MAVMWPITALLRESGFAVDAEQEAEDWVQLPEVGPFPSEAFDQFNHEGRRAVAYFLKACSPMRKLLGEAGVAESQWTEVMHRLLFRVEGDAVNRRVRFKAMPDLRERAVRATLIAAGLRQEFHEPGMALLRTNMHVLHEARRRVFGFARRESAQVT